MTLNGPDMELTVEAQLFEWGAKIGYSPEVVRKAIEERPERSDRRDLLRKWKRKHSALSASILRDVERREAEERAQKAWENHRALQPVYKAETNAERQSKSGVQRLSDVIRRLEQLSTVSAAQLEFNPNASHEDRILGNPEKPASFPHEEFDRKAGYLAQAAEAYLDRIVKRSEGELETPEDKDLRLIRDWENATSWEVATFAPEFGHPGSIERVRRKYGRTGRDGKPIRERREAA